LGNPLRVLIVEDSEADALLLVRELRRGGYDVDFERTDTLESLIDALDHREWDLVVSDYTMPQLCGTDALKLVREKNLDLPFIFASGTIGEDIAVAALKQGASDYVFKGNLKRLVPAIERELKEAELRRERRRGEKALWESEERYRTLAEAAHDMIFIINMDGHHRYINNYGARLFGRKPEEVIGLPLEDLFPAQIVERQRMSIRKILKTGEDMNEEMRIPLSGEDRWMEFHLVPVKDAAGNTNTILGIGRDITQRKALEDQLRHSQKLEGIGQLAGGIAHDFNNILNVIIGYGTLIEGNMEENDPSRLHLKEILLAGDRAARLTQSLLAFSRKQIIDPAPHDLNEIIKGVEGILRRTIGEDIQLISIHSIEKPTVLVDKGQMEQVLLNLAVNARDAMPRGGQLIMETEIFHLDKEYARGHGYGEPGMYVLLSVSDSGVGMDEDTRKKAFEPFFTTKEPGKGTGLGLSMVYGIVKQHDGYLNLYSEPGRGTTFKIYLPLIEGDLQETTGPNPAAYPMGGTETILVAEDDRTVRELTKSVLEKFGYSVIQAVDGEDAVGRFLDNKEKIRLLLLDVIMPKMDGKEVYENIKKINPDIKAIFLSGYTANLIQKRGVLNKGLNFILKPVSPKDLLRKTREVLDR
jgi:PAS domain S-box-containing protein